jgi:hypothetical protein
MVLHRHGAYWGRRFAAPTRRGRSVRGAARRGNRATDRCVAGPELRVYRKRSSGTDHRARVDGDRLRLVPRVALSAAKPGAEASPSKVCAGQGHWPGAVGWQAPLFTSGWTQVGIFVPYVWMDHPYHTAHTTGAGSVSYTPIPK